MSGWLRRALEAVVVAVAVSVVSLVGGRLSTGEAVSLPSGAPGALLLAPSVMALAVVPAAWPMAMAATRADSLLGALAALLIATDATLILASGALGIPTLDSVVPAGFLAVLLAAGPALLAIGAGQVAAPLGFGRRAGAWAAAVGAGASLVVLIGVALLV